ncbi:MAG: polysaccharide deacetylase family protein [Lentisphaeria bacterium]|nr:polysaccharide deacetylase family protein [Lentisphaeria bacterium]
MHETVILTFDDTLATQFAAAELVKRHGFGATFYVGRFREAYAEPEVRARLSAGELRELSRAGFEIGNHSVTHPDFSQKSAAEIKEEIAGMEQMMAAAGLPHPRTFAYPGGPFSECAAALLRERGYVVARTNEHRAYRPAEDSEMRIPAFPVADKYPGIFGRAMAELSAETPVVLIYHGVPDPSPHCSTSWSDFSGQMEALKKRKCRVTGLLEYFASSGKL